MSQFVADTVTNLIASFNTRRAFSLVIILMIFGTAAWTIDYYADFTRISRLDRATALLERLQALEGKTLSAELETVRLQIAGELKNLTAPAVENPVDGNSNALKEWIGRNWKKFIAGAVPWLLFSLLMLPAALKGETASIGAFFAFQILTVFFGALVAVIPPVGNRFVDLLLIPWGLLVFVAIVPIAIASVSAFRKVRESSKQKAILNNLRMLSAAADQYFLEKGLSYVEIDQLIGLEQEKYIKALTPIEGETYQQIIRQGEPLVAVRPSGEKVTWTA